MQAGCGLVLFQYKQTSEAEKGWLTGAYTRFVAFVAMLELNLDQFRGQEMTENNNRLLRVMTIEIWWESMINVKQLTK